MANFVYNIAKGRIHELAIRVNGDDPTNSAFYIAVINTTETDANLRVLNDMQAIEANANTAEVANSGYARIPITTIGVDVDDTNHWVDIDVADQTWNTVAAGTAWTDLLFLYDSDTGAGTDANVVPLTQHDFVVTPDGSDITAQIDSEGFFRAS